MLIDSDDTETRVKGIWWYRMKRRFFLKCGSLRLRTSAKYRKRFDEWGAALNAEAKRRGEEIEQDEDFPDYLPNIFYESFPVSEASLRKYWIGDFERGGTPAMALDAAGYVEWRRYVAEYCAPREAAP